MAQTKRSGLISDWLQAGGYRGKTVCRNEIKVNPPKGGSGNSKIVAKSVK